MLAVPCEDGEVDLVELADRVKGLSAPEGAAVVVGIAGPPGSGKTTLAEQLVALLNRDQPRPEGQRFAHVPMDGFHLSDHELGRLGLLGRKGAAETFDVHGYAALLERLRGQRDVVVYAPGFERTIEQPIAGVIPIFPSVRTILTEGNYLLLDRPGWREVRGQCTQVWYCEQKDAVRIERLVERHVAFGKSRTAAQAWVEQVDESNARLIEATRGRADLVVRVDLLD